MARHKHVINVSEVEPKEIAVGDNVPPHRPGARQLDRQRRAGLQPLQGRTRKIRLSEALAPAQRGSPPTSSKGAARSPSETTRSRCRRADYAALPIGRHLPHKLVNTGDSDLVYLCLSTNLMPEITEYPDSGKVGVLGGTDWNPVAGGLLCRQGRVRPVCAEVLQQRRRRQLFSPGRSTNRFVGP